MNSSSSYSIYFPSQHFDSRWSLWQADTEWRIKHASRIQRCCFSVRYLMEQFISFFFSPVFLVYELHSLPVKHQVYILQMLSQAATQPLHRIPFGLFIEGNTLTTELLLNSPFQIHWVFLQKSRSFWSVDCL